jgi:hypothetical protein
MNNQWFPNVTDLSVLFHDWCSTELFPSLVDFCKVTKLSLRFDFYSSPNQCVSDCLVHLLQQTSNVHSLSVDSRSDSTEHLLLKEKIYSTIIDHLDQSESGHLKIPVRHLNDTEMVLDRFSNLESITFTRWIRSIITQQNVKHLKTLMNDCSI